MTFKIGYAVSRFPLVTETFVLREMLELERRGWDIDLYSIIHERGSLVHPEALEFERRGQYLEAMSPRTLREVARLATRRPRLAGHVLGRTALGNLRSPGFLARGLAILPGTIELAARMRRRGIRHLHAHFGTHAALMAMLAAEINQIGFSFTVHAVDLYVDTTMLAEKVRKAKFVATISDFNRGLLIDLAGQDMASKIHVVRCGVDTASYQFSACAVPRSPVRLLAVGSLRDYKGQEYLIRACALLKCAHPPLDFTCTIIGEGPLRPRLEQIIAELGLSDQVHLVGARDQGQVLTHMSEADILVMPSVVAPNGLMEGIPVTLMEAMAVGLPTIATRISGIPELVCADQTGLLVDPNRPDAIAEAVLECLHDWSATQARAHQGRALVEREYSLAKNVDRLEESFESSQVSNPDLTGMLA